MPKRFFAYLLFLVLSGELYAQHLKSVFPLVDSIVTRGSSGEIESVEYVFRPVGRSITELISEDGTLAASYSYDPWGRPRDPGTLEQYRTDGTDGSGGSAPTLMLGRGYTGHEWLPWFALYNCNARLYDPLLGRFLEPDPYVQAPDFSQSFNRYAYALNNPLKYTDESGEYIGWDDLIAALVGGTLNWALNGCQLTWEGLGYFGVGAAAGVTSLYVSPIAVAGVMEASNSVIRQGRGDDGTWSLQNVSPEMVLGDGAMGIATSYIGGKISLQLSNALGRATSKIPGKAWEGLVNRGLTGAGTGFILGSGIAALNQWGQYKETGYFDWNAVWTGGKKASLIGLATGGISGMVEGVKAARKDYKNPWRDKDWYPAKKGFKGKPETGIMSPGLYDRYGSDNGSFLSPEGTTFEQRSLPSYKNDSSLYSRYMVVKPIPGVEFGEIAPWFGYPGGGTQYYLPHPIQYYIDNKYIIKL